VPKWVNESKGVSLTVHEFSEFWDSGMAYDATQCGYFQNGQNVEIEAGDIFIVPGEEIVGFLYKAWPVAVTETVGVLHTLNKNVSLTEDYDHSLQVAKDIARKRGYGVW
jgi:hypothetical protein